MRRMTWMLAAALVGIAGCKPGASEKAQADTAPVTPAATAEAPAPHPCTLLADASVKAAVPQAQAGQRDDSEENYGVTACRWAVADGAVVLQLIDAGAGALPHELRAATLEVVDVRRADAASLVRIEAFPGVADQAGAFVEQEDAKRGIRRPGAVLMVQRGSHLAVLRMPQLAQGDRGEALGTLKRLGGEIATRL